MEKEEKLNLMKKVEEEIHLLDGTSLCCYRKEQGYYPVVGEGDISADIIFVGEAPGRNEAKTGKPFCGSAGRVLDELLKLVSIKRENVYITNIVKDRPPKNRDPFPDEIEMYAPFLDRQIEIIQPKIIATLGRFSMEYVMRRLGLEKDITPIGKSHGKLFEAELAYGKVHILVLYHPCVAIYNPKTKDILKKDIKILKKFLKNK